MDEDEDEDDGEETGRWFFERMSTLLILLRLPLACLMVDSWEYESCISAPFVIEAQSARVRLSSSPRASSPPMSNASISATMVPWQRKWRWHQVDWLLPGLDNSLSRILSAARWLALLC